jgi:hypothetical protein
MRVYKARISLLDELDQWVEPGRPPGEEKGHELEVESYGRSSPPSRKPAPWPAENSLSSRSWTRGDLNP